MKPSSVFCLALCSLSVLVAAFVAWCGYAPAGDVTAVAPCNTIVSGDVTVTHTGSVWVTSGSNPATQWQFLRKTWSTGPLGQDAAIADDGLVRSEGQPPFNYVFGVMYDSRSKGDGTHYVFGNVSAKPYGSQDMWTPLDGMNGTCTVDN